MYLQGYFSLYEKELIEISQTKITEEIILILFESLKRMGKDDPVKEAKKALSLLVSYPDNKTESIINSLDALPDEDYKRHIKQPQQMSILEEVAKVTATDKAQPGRSNKPDDKVEFVSVSKRLSNLLKGKEIKEIGKSTKAAEPDKSEFGPGSKGVSNSVKVTPVNRKPVKTRSEKGRKG